jgi:predicted ABC-type ATPase
MPTTAVTASAATTAPDKRELIVVAGPNGSGKSTLAYEYLDEHPAIYLGVDEMAYRLAPHDPSSARLSAGREYFRALEGALETDESIMIESTLAGQGMRRTLKRTKAAGLHSTIVMIYLDQVGMSLARVRQRSRKGGHNIADKDVIRRFGRSLRNFWNEYRFLADEWLLVYNASREPVDVAVGVKDDVNALHEDLFESFIALVENEQNPA